MPHSTSDLQSQRRMLDSVTAIDLLQDIDDDAIHDLVGIGFGPASLAIAVAIYDILEQRAQVGNTSFMPKVKFLERQHQFGWHAGMLLPGTKMQISFLKDLATMRNPKSRFTFLNYLKEHDRLVPFANLNTFLPLRIEFEDYLKWTAESFSKVVSYSQDVMSVKPLKSAGSQKFDHLEVTSKDLRTGQVSTQRARNVVIAVGGRPSIPAAFPATHERVIHSSRYNHEISRVLPEKDKPYSIAVVGAGQSAAEVFNDVQSRYPNAKGYLVMRDTAMRPSDDSPFVNEVFNPEVIDTFYSSPVAVRSAQLKVNKATNYSVVRLNLLEEIYEHMYQQRIQNPDPESWQHKILPSREIVNVAESPEDKKLRLSMRSLVAGETEPVEPLTVDAVVLATGYIRDVHNNMLKDCQVINGATDSSWIAQRAYQVPLNRNLVEDNVQIYLQGCNEQTHGLSDTLLSVLASRGGEIVESAFGEAILEANTRDLVHGASSDMHGPLGPLWRLQKTNGINGTTKSNSEHLRAVQSSPLLK